MGLRGRLLLAFLLPTLVVLSIGGYGLYQASRNVLEEELGHALAGVAATVSSQLKAERVLTVEATDAQGEGTRTWRALTAQLSEAKEHSGLRRILVVDTDGRARLDVGGPLQPMMEATELWRDGLEVHRALSGERSSSQVLFEGTDGTLYKTGYAPLLLEGKVVGVVAVEGTAAFFGSLGRLRDAFLFLATLTVASLAAAAVLVARGLARPLEQLVAAALRIRGGDLLTAVNGAPGLEIGILSRELEAMRKALESRDRQLKLMLGGVAHEVKNPLGGIELFSGLLNEELASDAPNVAEARSHLGKIRRELEYLKRIVEDFLAFAKEQTIQFTRIEAQALLQSAAQHLQGEADSKTVTLAVDAQPATLSGDMSLLTAALVNLLKNAVQVSKTGQRVALTGRAEGPRYWIEVSDEGPGIPPEVQARIFEPFFTTREKGTGLGLPLARKVVEAHRGTLTVESRPGRTVFQLAIDQY